MNKLLINSSILILAISSPLTASILDKSTSIERIGFSIKNLKICHQLEWRNMTIDLEFESSSLGKSNEPTIVRNFVIEFLNNYPNEMDFWEIMNVKLVNAILSEFPEITILRSSLKLNPDRTLSFPRQSMVEYSIDQKALKESFSFTKLNYGICSETFNSLDLFVDFNIRENPGTFDYPDYQWVNDAINEFFKSHPLSFNKWQQLKPLLETFLLERFPTLTSMSVNVQLAH